MLVDGKVWRQVLARRRGGRLRLRALQRFFSSLHYCPARPATSERGAADIYIYIYIEQASLMHRRAIVLAFLPAALEVLAFLLKMQFC